LIYNIDQIYQLYNELKKSTVFVFIKKTESSNQQFKNEIKNKELVQSNIRNILCIEPHYQKQNINSSSITNSHNLLKKKTNIHNHSMKEKKIVTWTLNKIKIFKI
jgi:hypothetical protein